MLEVKKVTKLKWRQFIATEAGQEGLEWFKSNYPGIGTGEPHEIIFAAGRARQHHEDVEALVSLIDIVEKPEQDPDNK